MKEQEMDNRVRFTHVVNTFGEMLGQSDDQVLVRQLLMDLVPEEVKWKIVWHYNGAASDRNLRMLANEAGECDEPI